MNEKKIDNLSKDTLMYTIGNFFVKAVAVISAPIFTRLLSTNAYGKVTLYSTWLAFFGILICLELKGTIINAYVKFGKEEHKGYVKNCIFISSLALVVFEVFLLFFHNYTESLFEMPYTLCMIGGVHAFFNGMFLFYSHYLTMSGQSLRYIFVSGIQAVLNVFLSLVFIFSLPLERYLSRISGQFISSALIGIGIIYYFCANRKSLFNVDYSKFAFPLALPLLFHALSGIVLVGADKVMLSKLTTDSEVGIYGFAGAVLALLNTMTVSFYTAWRPYLFKQLEKKNFTELRERMGSYINCFTIVCIGFMLVQPELVKLLSEKSYWEAIPVVVPLALGEYFFFLYTSEMNYELFHQKNIWTPVGSIGAALINILINLVILKHMGAMGAAISTMISNMLLWLFHDIISRKMVKGYFYPFHNYIFPVFLILVCAVFASIIEDIPLLRWCIAICLGLVFLRKIYIKKSLF